MQQIHAGERAYRHWQQKSEQTKAKPAPQIQPQVEHINLKACKKHQIQQTHLTEYLETAVAVEQIKPEWTHCHTGYNQAHYVRHANHVQQQRRKQDYHQHQKEYQHRVGYHRLCCQNIHRSSPLVYA